MSAPGASPQQADRNVRLYPWFRVCQSLLFWQAVWFLYFQNSLSAAEAILLYVISDIASTVLEVPSGYMSDRLGRRRTLIAASVAMIAGSLCLAMGTGFAVFAMGQVLLGASFSFVSGTDSSMLYESLTRAGRAQEIERQELKAWRYGFVALAASAAAGGAMAMVRPELPYLAAAGAGAGMLAVTLAFREPRAAAISHPGAELARMRSLIGALRLPVLAWLLGLSVAMYVFSHIPFVFGQPVIQDALSRAGLGADAPWVSGSVSALMMLISVATSLLAARLRRFLGLPAILLLAFALQIGLVAGLALSGSSLVIALLLIRMVPNSLSHPFILARVQPLLGDDSRATYLSVQSLMGKLVFAASLWLASGAASSQTVMAQGEIRTVLGWYAVVGLVVFAGLAVAARRVRVETAPGV